MRHKKPINQKKVLFFNKKAIHIAFIIGNVVATLDISTSFPCYFFGRVFRYPRSTATDGTLRNREIFVLPYLLNALDKVKSSFRYF
jgi:hypothetical protein